MFMPPGGFGPPMSGDGNPKKRPKGIKNFFPYIFKTAKDMIVRLLYIYRLVWDAKPLLLFIMSFKAVFNGISPLISAYIAKLFLDTLTLAVTGQDVEWSTLILLLVLQLGFQLFVQVVNSVGNMITRLSSELLSNSIKLKIMSKAKTVDLAFFDLPEFYSKLENATLEAGRRPIQVLEASFSIVSSFISLISFITVLGAAIPWAPPLIIVLSVPMAVVTYKYRKKNFSYMRRRSKDRRQMDYYANLIVDKDLVKEVKLFNLSDFFIGRYTDVFKNYFKGLKSLIVNEGLWGIGFAILSTAVNGSVFFRIVQKCFAQELTIGDYSLYTNAIFSISNGVSSIISTSASIYEGTLFIDNMLDFMKTPTYIVPSLSEPRHVDKRQSHTIEFSHVSFAYPGTQKKVLNNVSFKIGQGDTVVLVGLNGAGKTTLLKLLTRLYDPTSGVIYLDGHDIREYDIKELYSIFGIIFQDFGKYAFTVSENISFGEIARAGDLEKVKNAAECSAAGEFIDKLRLGYDTPLMRVFEENGTELSIGQWQKIAVARAFFRNSEIMILDEPTASLDPLAEQEIFSQFDKLRRNKLTVFVSHRLSSATLATKIFFLENGKIVEQGTHRELMDMGGKYRDLFVTQAKRYIEETGDENGNPDLQSDKEPHEHRRERSADDAVVNSGYDG